MSSWSKNRLSTATVTRSRSMGNARESRLVAATLLARQLALPVEPGAETLALHIEHREPDLAGRFAGVVDREDVGVLEPSGEVGLAPEAIGLSVAASSGRRTSKATGRSCLRSWAKVLLMCGRARRRASRVVSTAEEGWTGWALLPVRSGRSGCGQTPAFVRVKAGEVWHA